MKKINKLLVIGLASIVALAFGLSALVIYPQALWVGDDFDGYYYNVPLEYEHFYTNSFLNPSENTTYMAYGYSAPYYMADEDEGTLVGWHRSMLNGLYDNYMWYDFPSELPTEIYGIRISLPDCCMITNELPTNLLGLRFDNLGDFFDFAPEVAYYRNYYSTCGVRVNVNCYAVVSDTLTGGDFKGGEPVNQWAITDSYYIDINQLSVEEEQITLLIADDFNASVNTAMAEKAQGLASAYPLIDNVRDYVYVADYVIELTFDGYAYDTNPNYAQRFSTYVQSVDERAVFVQRYSTDGVYDKPNVPETVVFVTPPTPVPPEGVIDWLTNTISGIFNTNLFGIEGVTLGTLLLIPICAGAIIGLLKLFAGG